ncbi:MAG: tetratricopeptide repeat protein [Myxococcales bacterium]
MCVAMLRAHLFSLIAIIGLGAATHRLHASAASASPSDSGDSVLYLPNGTFLRHFSLGQPTTLADFYWLKLVQYIGGVQGPQPHLFPLANLITDLDPEYGYAYLAPAMVISSKKRFEEANELLLKGVENNVPRWEIPFNLAFNYWYELQDYERGAKYLKLAVAVPGRPEWLPVLVGRLLATAGNVDSAIQFVQAMLEQAPDEKTRADLEHKVVQFRYERDVQLLEKAVAEFQRIRGGLPWGFAELDSRLFGLLLHDSSEFEYDPATGEVTCRKLERRWKVKRPSEIKVNSR